MHHLLHYLKNLAVLFPEVVPSNHNVVRFRLAVRSGQDRVARHQRTAAEVTIIVLLNCYAWRSRVRVI